ncbi:MAG: hypothetical protein E7L06_08310 [Schaalia turicensis]|nr:hypothetical protein [Schaalia turicensis]
MTKNIEIDLESIPHPKDCHPVPDGAIIPAGTPFWLITGEDRLTWATDGYSEDCKMQKFSSLRLTAEPIIPRPTPEDSPMIITRTSRAGVDLDTGAFAVWVHNEREWCVTTERGGFFWLDSGQITDWLPAIVTKSGHGVWDERDKRSRVDAEGDIWLWSRAQSVWVCLADYTRSFGSLSALRELHGNDFPCGVAGEEGGEE